MASIIHFAGKFSSVLIFLAGCITQTPNAQHDLSPPVVIKQPDMDALHEQLAARVASANSGIMTKPGLVGALGGVRVKLLKSGSHEVFLPLPQMVDGQVPICYYIRNSSQKTAVVFRIQRREDLNDIVSVQLTGERNQEVQLEWSSVILVAETAASSTDADLDEYRSATACVQADSPKIKQLAEKLWPENGRVEDYAQSIQRHIQGMKRVKQPGSLDALGILDSGMNGICTANANLALALMRAKGISSRSMAVIPPTSQKLEMHRIVEYRGDDQWHYFDPSSLHADIPMKPWQTLIMAKTSLVDENLAMKPRIGTMVGCPYGQEVELVSRGITLLGQDFFWTTAKPLREFAPDYEVITLASELWKQYLNNGQLSDGQVSACTATNLAELRQRLKQE
jgi:hypothetical protein